MSRYKEFTESYKKASKAYRKNTVDQITIVVPKGTKADLEQIALDKGYTRNGKASINMLVNAIIAEYLKSQN